MKSHSHLLCGQATRQLSQYVSRRHAAVAEAGDVGDVACDLEVSGHGGTKIDGYLFRKIHLFIYEWKIWGVTIFGKHQLTMEIWIYPGYTGVI